ncbi:MAG TPA: hypothetical protein VEV43_01895 [Actinomycetota bacterium]|nr:hypothetical protein [Actinomycetota bacterium]
MPEIGGAGTAATKATAGLDLAGAETIVIASPHSTRTGVYKAARGDLDAFGPRGIDVSAETDAEAVEALAARWGRPVLDAPADHGIVVPLRLIEPSVPVVTVAFAEGADAAEPEGLADAVSSLGGAVAFVASANLSAGLTERSPLPSLPGAAEADAAVLDALRQDPAALAHVDFESAGSCAAPVLATFGSLFAGHPCDVLAYEHPFGVGYAVARTR